MTKHEKVINIIINELNKRKKAHLSEGFAEISSYENWFMEKVYDDAGLVSRKETYNLPLYYKTKAVLSYVSKECNLSNHRLKREWEKTISGIDTFIMLAD